MARRRSGGVHHVAIRALDVAALARFYAGVFRFARLDEKHDDRGLRAVWLAAGVTIVMIERREPGEPAPDARSLDAIIFAIAADERAPLKRRLSRRRVAVEGETAYSLYLRDPEGRRVGASHYPAVR
jgi:catechol-2,3-dioxygenase